MGHLTEHDNGDTHRTNAPLSGSSMDHAAVIPQVTKAQLGRVIVLIVVTNALVWYAGAWCFGFAAAGYLDSTGRFANSIAYHGFLTSSLKAPIYIGIAISILVLSSLLFLLPDRRRHIGSNYHGVSDCEMRVVQCSSILGAIAWGIVAATMAREYASALMIAGVILGAVTGSLAGMIGAAASIFLLRRPTSQFWTDAAYVIVGGLVVWFAIHRVLASVLASGGGS